MDRPLEAIRSHLGHHRDDGGPHDAVAQREQGCAQVQHADVRRLHQEEVRAEDRQTAQDQGRLAEPSGELTQDRAFDDHQHEAEHREEDTDVRDVPIEALCCVDRERRVKDVERQKNHEVEDHHEEHVRLGENGAGGNLTRLGGEQTVPRLLPENPPAFLARAIREPEKPTGLGQREGDHADADERDRGRREHRHQLSEPGDSEDAGDRWTQDHAEVRCHPHTSKVTVAFLPLRDVGDVGVRDRDVPPCEPVERPRQKDHR